MLRNPEPNYVAKDLSLIPTPHPHHSPFPFVCLHSQVGVFCSCPWHRRSWQGGSVPVGRHMISLSLPGVWKEIHKETWSLVDRWSHQIKGFCSHVTLVWISLWPLISCGNLLRYLHFTSCYLQNQEIGRELTGLKWELNNIHMVCLAHFIYGILNWPSLENENNGPIC